MGSVEKRRLDLYNAVADKIGEEQATTLMDFLPTVTNDQPATTDQFELLRRELSELKSEVREVHTRIDRLFYALVSVPVLTVGLIRLVESV
jgi:archaellum component FlaC